MRDFTHHRREWCVQAHTLHEVDSPEVHRRAVIAAELAGRSLNQWAEEVLGKAAG